VTNAHAYVRNSTSKLFLLHETQTVLEKKQVWLQTAQICLVCLVVFRVSNCTLTQDSQLLYVHVVWRIVQQPAVTGVEIFRQLRLTCMTGVVGAMNAFEL